jgi:hypothetical protein
METTMETTLLSQRERIQKLSDEYELLTVEQLTLEAVAHSESERRRRHQEQRVA